MFGRERHPELFWHEINKRYSESHRHYHNLAHIEHCMEVFKGYNRRPSRPGELHIPPIEIDIAIFFHDIIYNPLSKTNEQDSFDLFQNTFGKYWQKWAIKDMYRLIMSTKHDHVPLHGSAKLMQDIDLAILGETPDKFDKYEAAIRLEYGMFSDLDYMVGRCRVLNKFLSKKHIYNLKYFRGKYEKQARENIKRAIRKLES